MKKKDTKKIIGIAIFLIIIVISIIRYFQIPTGVVYKENTASQVIGFSIDDLSSWAVYNVYDGKKEDIQISEVDIKNNRQIQSKIISSTIFNQIKLYPQNNNSILFVEQEDGLASYRLEHNAEPIFLDKINTDTIFFEDPKIWGNQIYYLGENTQGDKIIQIISNGESKIIDMKTVSDFGSIIKEIDWYSSSTKELPFIEIETYLDESIMMLPFLNEQGQFELIARVNSSQKWKANLKLELMKQYYSNKTMLSPQKQDDGYYLFEKGTGTQLDNPNMDIFFIKSPDIELIELGNQKIFNVETRYLADNQILIMGTTGLTPTTTKITYLVDQTTNEIQRLNDDFNQIWENSDFNTLNIYLQNNKIYIDNRNTLTQYDLINNETQEIVSQQILQAEIKEDKTRLARLGDMILAFIKNPIAFILIIIIIIGLSTRIGGRVVMKMLGNKRDKVLKESVMLTGEVISSNFTGTTINSAPQVLMNVRFIYEGKTLERETKVLVQPGQAVMPGMRIGIAYNVSKDKIMVLKSNDFTGESEKPIIKEEFATIISIQKTGYTYEQSEAVILTLKKKENKELQIVTLESKALPYFEGEKIEIAEVNGRATILSRSSKYTITQKSIRKDMETIEGTVVDFTMTDITILGKNLYTFRTMVEKDSKTMIMESADFLPLNIGVIDKNIPMQVNLERTQLEQRLNLQNRKQAAAIVETIEINGDAFGVNPFVVLSVKLIDSEEKYTIKETSPVWQVPNIDDKVWVGYDESKKIATIINDMN